MVKLMFKKLILMVLAISSSYGMEVNKNTENNIAENVTQQLSNITLDNTENGQLSSVQQSNNQPILFDIIHLAKTKHFKDMTKDEKDWMRLRAYDNFSKSCQTFIQIAFATKNITKELKDKFYNTVTIKFCILTGLHPRQIFEDELKFNVDRTCYEGKIELTTVMTKLNKVAQSLDKDMEHYRGRFVKLGQVNNFDIQLCPRDKFHGGIYSFR